MKTLYVYADFDWLDEPMLVGELGYESLRGSDSYSFKYDNDWLRIVDDYLPIATCRLYIDALMKVSAGTGCRAS